MNLPKSFVLRLLLLIIAFCLFAQVSLAQRKPEPQPAQGDVIRINTELVQTDVMIFDKQGRFVEGLLPEQLN